MVMAYSNDVNQIRAGLTNYIGAVQAAISESFQGRAKNQLVAGILMDEVMKCSQVEPNTPCDPYILVPMFKGICIFLRQQQQLMSQEQNTENKEKIEILEDIIQFFEMTIKEQMPNTKGHL